MYKQAGLAKWKGKRLPPSDRQFESDIPLQASVAQRTVQRATNALVAGSNPAGGSVVSGYAYVLTGNAATWGAGVNGNTSALHAEARGSTPLPSTEGSV